MNEQQWNEQLQALISQYGSLEAIPLNIYSQLASQAPATVQAKAQAELDAVRQGVANKTSVLGDFLSRATQLGVSLNQLGQANRMASQVQRPDFAPIPQLNPSVTQALYEARRGVMNQDAVLAPARQELQDAYLASLESARQTGGGQAGAAQAMANLANLQRMQASNQLVPMAQQVRMQNQGVYNDLLGLRQREQEAIQNAQQLNTQIGFDQYNRDAWAVGGMRGNAITNAMQALPGAMESLSNLTPYFVGMKDEDKQYAEKVAMENANNLTSRLRDEQFNQLRSNPRFNPNAFSAQRYDK